MMKLYAVAAKEFWGYFRTYTAYVVLAVYLLLSLGATFYVAYFFEYNNRNLISFFMYQPIILNLILPALTMKMWAEERRQGTLEFLLTQPVSYKELVVGKFLAAMLFCMLLIVSLLPFILYTSTLIELDGLNICASIFAEILVMALLCALGCLVSALNNNTILAYLATLFCGWFVEGVNFNFLLKPIGTMFPLLNEELKGILNFNTHYQQLLQGQMNIASIGYFILLTIGFLWLNKIVIQYNKK